ncbi:MAG: type II secretion system inner membrane protein GspF [Deltaproteobacteria bacterium]|nr:MAG: type II secretion system inner membrane protein GspF [Deltaproteobacteria bacterium]
MPVYAYKGVTASGRRTRGFVDAETPRAARAKLRRDAVFPTELEESGAAERSERSGSREISLDLFRRVSVTDLALATRQLATLVGAGIPLVAALSALSQQVDSPKLKSVIGQVRDRVNEGANLADAMEDMSTFSTLYVSMVRAGEVGGTLDQVLVRLADYLENQARLRSKVGSVLIYPAVMFVFAMVVVAALVTVVLPRITDLLVSMNRELPIYTRVIISVSEFARGYWWLVLLLLVAALIAVRAFARTQRGRVSLDQLKLSLPVLGGVNRVISISRFSRTLSTLLTGGVPIVRALDIAEATANNAVIGRAIDAARKNIMEGAPLAKPLQASGEFPPLVTVMVDVGERSGELESMLSKIADTYDEQVETVVTRLTALLEPLLILVMVGVVLVIIMGTLMPLLQVMGAIE